MANPGNKASIVDLNCVDGKYVLSTAKTNSNKNVVGVVLDDVNSFADKLTVSKCYQFGESNISSIAGLGGQCSTNIMDMLETTLKNNAIMRFINTNIKNVNNAINGVKSFTSAAIK